jgi:serine/threonine-protein kinase
MAEVWRADAILDDGERFPVAIKRVLPRLAKDPLYRSMFEDEARLGMRLRHPNVVRVFDAREVAGTFLMVMELVDGTSLKGLLDRAHARKACMPVATALHMVRELGRALEYAHGATGEDGAPLSIIHRDVSPHNILLGRTGAVKLTDFGLANASVHRTVHSSERVGGKIGYLAPEVVLGAATDHRIDLYAAGIVLWEALCGRRLFHGRDDAETVRNVVRLPVPRASEHNPHVGLAVDELVASLLDRNPSRRVGTATELVERASVLVEAIDPDVGSRDIALLVGLHLASEPVQRSSATGLDGLMHELDAFVHSVSHPDLGAAPLDPAAFATGRISAVSASSGVRPMPSDDEDEDTETGGWSPR